MDIPYFSAYESPSVFALPAHKPTFLLTQDSDRG